MKREWLAFLSAVQFLTRLPVPDPGWEDGRLDRAAMYFPVVGILIGILSGAILGIAQYMLGSSMLAVILACAAGILMTGALHEDGLADFADGMGGGRDRLHRLEIMKDSRIGTYGALALIVMFAVNVTALMQLSFVPALAITALIAAHGISRAVLPVIAGLTAYARAIDADATAPLTNPIPMPRVIGLAVFAALSLIPLMLTNAWAMSHRPVSFGLTLAFATLATLCVAGIVTVLSVRKIGGWTGDTLGATQAICFSTFLIFAGSRLWT